MDSRVGPATSPNHTHTYTLTNQTAFIFYGLDARPEVKASSRDACSCAAISFPMHVAHKHTTPAHPFLPFTHAPQAEMEDASFGEINKEVGARWNALTDAEKAPYVKVCVRWCMVRLVLACVHVCVSPFTVGVPWLISPPLHPQKAEKDKKRFEKEKAAFEKAGGVFQTKVRRALSVCACLGCCPCMHVCSHGCVRSSVAVCVFCSYVCAAAAPS